MVSFSVMCKSSQSLLFLLSLFVISFAFVSAVAEDNQATSTILSTSSGLQFLRTPDSRFENITDYAYETKYLSFSGLRIAYVDEGSSKFGTILLLHASLQWGYGYRRFVPILTRAGYRVIIPDFIGAGKSDKPINKSAYSFAMHVNSVKSIIENLNLRKVHLIGVSWGSNAGLAAAVDNPDTFESMALSNFPILPNISALPGVIEFRKVVTKQPFGGTLVRSFAHRNLTNEEVLAYQAPFPSVPYTAGLQAFPTLAAVELDHPEYDYFKEFQDKLKKWEKPVLLLWALEDRFVGAGYTNVLQTIPGTKGQPHQLFLNKLFLINEDAPEELALASAQWFRQQPKNSMPLTCS